MYTRTGVPKLLDVVAHGLIQARQGEAGATHFEVQVFLASGKASKAGGVG